MKKYLLTLLISLNATVTQAEIYKWTDEQGNTHYGDKPVVESKEMDINIEKSGNQKEKINRKERQKKLVDSMQEDRLRKKEEAEKLKKEKQKHKRNCARAKEKLKGYERAGYLYNFDKEGNKVISSNEDRQKATDGLRKKIKKNCK